ncbi:mutator-like element [Apiospora hydei]|uniref:Mutator-like element n=1 Tax=Apiospora hydei TaxID=1337664 RepID=A0ABR1W8Y3_9PEZI
MSTANDHNPHSHPGLAFPQVNGLRRTYTSSSHSATPPKPSPTPQQHQSPYQPQQYTPQQPPQAHYPHNLFTSSTPSPVPGVNGVQNVPNGASRHTPPRHTARLPWPPAANALAMNQPMPQQVQQHVQQPVPQPVQPVQPLQQQPHQAHQNHQTHQAHQAHQAHQTHQTHQAHQNHQNHQTHQTHQGHPVAQQVQPLPQQQPVQQQPQPVHQPNDANLMFIHSPIAKACLRRIRRITSRATRRAIHRVINRVTRRATRKITNRVTRHVLRPTPSRRIRQVTNLRLSNRLHRHIKITSRFHHKHTNHLRHYSRSRHRNHQPTVQQQESHNDDDMDMDSQDESGEGDSHLSPKLIEGTPFVPRTPMGGMMSAPPEGGSYASLEAVHRHVLEYCTSVGYAVVIGRSKKTVPGLKKVLFVCDRAGKPPSRVSPEQRKRKTSSRKCNCQFGFFAIEQRTQWTIRYRPDEVHLQHNHGPSESPLLHPAARKLDSKMVAAVKQLKESGIGVSQTLEILQQQNPHVPLLPRDIYNARAAINRNPQKVEAGIAEERPAIYSKPAPTPEERIRSDLRRELANTKEELKKLREESKKTIEKLQEDLRTKDKTIEKFEMFIDICNQRVMLQREKLADNGGNNTANGGANS